MVGVRMAMIDARARSLRSEKPRSYGLVSRSAARPTCSRAAATRSSSSLPRAGRDSAAERDLRLDSARQRSGGRDSGTRCRPEGEIGYVTLSHVPIVNEDGAFRGASRPLKCRTSVDLPDPFWPTIATREPGSIVADTLAQRPRAIGVDEPEVSHLDRRIPTICTSVRHVCASSQMTRGSLCRFAQ